MFFLVLLVATPALCGVAQAGESFLDPGFVAEVGCGFRGAEARELLPGGWTLGGQQARRDRLTCRFRGPDGSEVETVLSNPDGPCEGGIRARRFCIQGSAVPGEVLDALRQQMDRAGADDPWVEPGGGWLSEQAAEAFERMEEARRDVLWSLTQTFQSIRAEYFFQAVWLLTLFLVAFRLFKGVRATPWNVSLARILLFLGALGLRFALRTEGPGDIFFHMGDGFTGFAALSYGVAPGALVQLLLRVLPVDLDVLFGSLLIIGATAPVFLGLALTEWEGDLRLAHVAGWLLAFHPIAVRFSGAANRSTHVLALGTLALWSLVRYVRRRDRIDLALHALALTLMVQSRPEAFAGLPLFTLAVVAVAPGRWAGGVSRLPRDVLGVQIVVGVLAVINALITGGQHASGMTMALYLQEAGGLGLSIETPAFLTPALQSWMAIVLCYAGIVWAFLRPGALPGWSVVALAIAAIPSFVMPTDDGDLANARYQLLTAMPSRIVVAIAIVRTADLFARLIVKEWMFPAVALTLLGGVGFASQDRLLSVTAPRTIDHEFAFLIDSIGELPPDAEIVYVYPLPERIWDFSLRPPEELSTILGRPDHRWIAWEPDLPESDRPRFFYRQAACSVAIRRLEGGLQEYMREVRHRCGRLLDTCRHQAVVEERVPALRWEADYYLAGTVPLGIYRLDQASVSSVE